MYGKEAEMSVERTNEPSAKTTFRLTAENTQQLTVWVGRFLYASAVIAGLATVLAAVVAKFAG